MEESNSRNSVSVGSAMPVSLLVMNPQFSENLLVRNPGRTRAAAIVAPVFNAGVAEVGISDGVMAFSLVVATLLHKCQSMVVMRPGPFRAILAEVHPNRRARMHLNSRRSGCYSRR